MELNAEFWDKLAAKYLQHSQKEWEDEQPVLEELLTTLAKQLGPRYTIVAPLGVGGIGIVLAIIDHVLTAKRAVKFPRPKQGSEDLFAEIITTEITQLREAVHQNIIEIYDLGDFEVAGRRIPYYVMEYVDKGEDAQQYLEARRDTITEAVLLRALTQILEGLAHLHANNVLHLDVKLENILISPNGERAVISDLGSARTLPRSPEDSEDTLVICTETYAHPELLRLLKNVPPTNNPNRLRGIVKRSSLKPIFDLYALGKNLLRILSIEGLNTQAYTRKYLQLMACRLLDATNTSAETALGLPAIAFTDIKYSAISAALIDLKKLTGEYSLVHNIPELDRYGIRTLQASTLTPTPLTDRLQNIISHPAFQRLNAVSQLGFIVFIYPTAVHSRLEHILGTFSTTVRYCDALWNDPINPLFRQIMTEEDLKAVLLAALCHDFGQYALGHDFEEAEMRLFSHEDIAVDLLNGLLHPLSQGDETAALSPEYLDMQTLRDMMQRDWAVSASRVADILSAEPKTPRGRFKDRLLHTIIDGPIDADKMDYLVRDSLNLGVTFGRAIDFERLLQCLTIIFRQNDDQVHVALGIHEKGKIPAETLTFTRYAMFGTVYWHHASRAAKSMLHEAVWETLASRTMQPERLRHLLVQFVLDTHRTAWSSDPSDVSLLLHSDREILEWLSKLTTPTGRVLLRMILRRELYKRLLVISKDKNEKLWDQVSKFPDPNSHPQSSPRWLLLFKVRRELNRRLLGYMNDASDRWKLQAIDSMKPLLEANTPVLLLDIPSRPGSDLTLEYLPESDRREVLEEWKQPSSLENSVIWKQLYGAFIESVGKARVFCHPEVVDAVDRVFLGKRSDLQNIVRDSIDTIYQQERDHNQHKGR